jgi:hypothetical protein
MRLEVQCRQRLVASYWSFVVPAFLATVKSSFIAKKKKEAV